MEVLCVKAVYANRRSGAAKQKAILEEVEEKLKVEEELGTSEAKVLALMEYNRPYEVHKDLVSRRIETIIPPVGERVLPINSKTTETLLNASNIHYFLHKRETLFQQMNSIKK